MNKMNQKCKLSLYSLSALLLGWVGAAVPESARAGSSPMMSAQVAPPSQVMGLGLQTQQGLGVSFLFWDSVRNTLRSGTNVAPNPNNQQSQSLRYTLLLDYNVYKDITALISIPYVYNHVSETGFDEKTSGIGDISFYLKYPFYRDQLFNARQEIQGIFGIEAPTGSSSESNAHGALIPATEQAGSGSVNYIIGGAWIWAFSQMSMHGSLTYKVYGPAAYHFGNNLGIDLGANYPLPPVKSLSLTADWLVEAVDRDHFTGSGPGLLPNGDVDNSGGVTFFLAPGLQWQPIPNTTVSFSVQVPVYQNFLGTQLQNEVNYTAAISARFGGSK